MAYSDNYTGNPQQDWESHKEESCPDCGSERKEYSHYDSNDGTNWSMCLDCDTIYQTF